jgi:hypothetical protein
VKPSTLRREHPAPQKWNFVNFFPILLVIFALLDPDSDTGTPLNPDSDTQHCLTGSKTLIIFSNTLLFAVIIYLIFWKNFWKIIFSLQAEATAALGEVVEGAGGGEEALEEEEEEEEESQQQQQQQLPAAAVEFVNEDNSSEPSSSTGTSQLRTNQQQQHQQQQALAIETDGGQVRLLF